jgi:hypothetical protein
MLTTPSQCRALAESSCPAAWHGGVRTRPTFRRHPNLPPAMAPALDAAGVHALLRAAGLPEAELRHMGAGRAVLEPETPWIAERLALELLGRIAFDAEAAIGGVGWGYAWLGDGAQRARAAQLGAQAVRRWFHV